jgi:hypothetical protein
MSARSRMLGAAAVACGALMALLPVLPWYAATLRSGTASLSGYGAGGASWILPVIGAALACAGGLIAWWHPVPGSRTARALGGVVIVLAAAGAAWTAVVALAPRVDVVVVRTGVPDAPLSGEWAIGVLPPAWACLAAAALAGMAGILLMVPSRRFGGAEHGDP